MRQQLRLRVVLPLGVLALLGAGFGAYAVGQAPPARGPLPATSGAADTGATDSGTTDTGRLDTGAAETKPAPGPEADPLTEPLPEAPLEPEPEPAEELTAGELALDEALAENRAVVVAFYTPAAGLDRAAFREARAGAGLAGAGFVAVNVTREGLVSSLAVEYEVAEAPAVLVFLRGPRLAARFAHFTDRQTVAQAVVNALR